MRLFCMVNWRSIFPRISYKYIRSYKAIERDVRHCFPSSMISLRVCLCIVVQRYVCNSVFLYVIKWGTKLISSSKKTKKFEWYMEEIDGAEPYYRDSRFWLHKTVLVEKNMTDRFWLTVEQWDTASMHAMWTVSDVYEYINCFKSNNTFIEHCGCCCDIQCVIHTDVQRVSIGIDKQTKAWSMYFFFFCVPNTVSTTCQANSRYWCRINRYLLEIILYTGWSL